MSEPEVTRVEARIAPATTLSNKRFQHVRAQVDEVVGMMQINVDKVLERDERLAQLDDRTDALAMGASQFEKNSSALNRKYWYRNLKMAIILILIFILLAIFIFLLLLKSKSN